MQDGTPTAPSLPPLRNRTFDEIAVGDSASLERSLTAEDIQLYAVMSGDVNPTHVDHEYASSSRYSGVIAHGMWGASLISALLGTRLPGPGTHYLGQTLEFLEPVRIGDTLTVTVTVTARDPSTQQVTLHCRCVNQDGLTVIEGEAEVVAPTEHIDRDRATLPEVRLDTGGGGTRRLLDHVRPLGAVRMAVVHPCNALSLSGAMDARAAGLIEPVLVGPRARIEAAAD